MMLKEDSSLCRLLGPELSRLLEYRSMRREGSSNLPDDASPFAIHPQVLWLRVFKKLVMYCGLFYLFEVPVRITFRVAHRLGPWYLFFDHMFDAVLIADICLQFFTAYVNKKSVLTYDLRRIGKHFLSTTFPLDMAAAFPLDALAMMTNNRNSSSQYVDYSLMVGCAAAH